MRDDERQGRGPEQDPDDEGPGVLGPDHGGEDTLGDAGSDATDALTAGDLDEGSNLGLTDEFARIEAEIQGEQGGAEDESAADEDAEDAEDAAPHEPGPEHEDEPEPEPAAEPEPVAAGPIEPMLEEEGAEVEVAEAEVEVAEAEAEPVAGGPSDVAEPEPEPEPEPQAPAAPAGTTPIAGPAPLAVLESDLEMKGASVWARFLAGSVMVVAAISAAVAANGLLFFEDVAAKLDPIPGVKHQLEEIASDAPQTIMLVGTDKRVGGGTEEGDPARSDTTMLLRVDPSKKVLSLFSLPRDLKAFIPKLGTAAKLNEAYAVGGTKETLKTVKSLTGLDINHVVEVDFQGFADAVNAIDCVFVDVDRRYFNDNSTTTPAEGYAEIDVKAGYQRLCGLKALQYVRYRHSDNDIVRAARQQDFLREARQKVRPRQLLPDLLGRGNELVDIFTEYTSSDIASADQIIGVLKSFIAVKDVPVNEVHFKGDIGGPDNPFVTATDEQVQKAVREFLNGSGSEGQRGGEEASKNGKANAGKSKEGKGKSRKEELSSANVVSVDDIPDENLKFGTLAQRFVREGAKTANRIRIPFLHPTVLLPGSSYNATSSRVYDYRINDTDRERAYKTVIVHRSQEVLPEYYGVTGTTWDDPPILRNPSETRKIEGREYLLFYDGDRLRLVGWKQDDNSYWLNNTLLQSIDEREMLAIATSMAES